MTASEASVALRASVSLGERSAFVASGNRAREEPSAKSKMVPVAVVTESNASPRATATPASPAWEDVASLVTALSFAVIEPAPRERPVRRKMGPAANVQKLPASPHATVTRDSAALGAVAASAQSLSFAVELRNAPSTRAVRQKEESAAAAATFNQRISDALTAPSPASLPFSGLEINRDRRSPSEQRERGALPRYEPEIRR